MFHVTLRQLHIFEAVARHLSYSRAAEELFLTQPAVSMQIKQLEDNVGLALFEQLGKKIFLTEAGGELHKHSKVVIAQVREAIDALEGLKGVDRGRLNIAVVSTAKYFAPSIVANFCARYPGVTLNLAVNNRHDVVDLIIRNETDLAIMGQPPEDLDVAAEAFAYHPLGIVAAPEHALASAKRISLIDLAKEKFIVREPGSATRAAMERVFAAHRMSVDPALQMSSNETIKQAVMAGMGISFLSLHTIGLELEAGRVAILDVEGLPVMRRWYLTHRAGKRLPPVAGAFKQHLLNEGANLLASVLPARLATMSGQAPDKLAKLVSSARRRRTAAV